MDFIGIVERNAAKRCLTDNKTVMGEDGRLYCSMCHTPRQCWVTLPTMGGAPKKRLVPCLCKCMKEKAEKEQAEQKKVEQFERIKRYRKLGFPDAETRESTFAVDDHANQKLSAAMLAYCKHFGEFRKEGKGLLLYGPVGTGKSFYAACIVNALIDAGHPCLMTNFSRLTNEINSTWENKQEYIDSLTRFSLVAIDDLGVERDSSYMNENVTTIVDTLYKAGTPMVITSNFTPKQLTEETDIRRRRVYDRLLERCHPIEVNGESRRKLMGRASYRDMKAILGV